MSISTYSELQDAIKSWLNKENAEVTARIPDFIAFGENATFRQLRSRYNEVSVTFDSTIVDNTQGVTIPLRYKEAKSLTYGDRLLQRKTDQWWLAQDKTIGPSQPLYYARVGDLIKIWPYADENQDAVMIYWEQERAISDQYNPNLFFFYPEVYLFGALIEAYPFLHNQDPTQLAIWQSKYNEVLGQISAESWKEENSGSTSVVSAAYVEPRF